VLTYRTGAAGVPGVAKSMAAHLLTETQVPEIQAKLAGYYGNGMVADSLNQSAALPRADMDPQIAKALGIDPTRALSETEVAHLLTGLRADGEQIKGKQVQASTKDRTRIAYADFTLSAPKSFSVALALAPTEAERAMLDRAHRKAAEWTMNHIAEQIGLSRKGKGGKDGYDQAHVAWIQFDHYTARPTVKVPVVENGIATTELLTVKVAGDPQRHTHFIIPNAVISKADGAIGAKVWATSHFFLAPARLGQILYGCAGATVPVRAEPSRA
jgi:TrwC relaxase